MKVKSKSERLIQELRLRGPSGYFRWIGSDAFRVARKALDEIHRKAKDESAKQRWLDAACPVRK